MRNEKEYTVSFLGVKSKDSRSVVFNGMGALPISFVDFEFSQSDALPVEIKYRAQKDDTWRTAARGTIFRYTSGGELKKNAPFKVETCAPYWLLDAKDYTFSSVPKMVTTWSPHSIVFLARGSGNWTLSYGSAAAVQKPASIIFSESEFPLNTATIVGDEFYTPRNDTHSAQNFILWSALIAAVLLLSGFAFYIAKKIKV
jgi:hypothetical protein